MFAIKNRVLRKTIQKSAGLLRLKSQTNNKAISNVFSRWFWSHQKYKSNYRDLNLHFSYFPKYFWTKECQGITIQKEGEKEKITVDLSKVRGAKMGNTGQYLIMYTWNVCQHRQMRTFTKGAYHHGVVIVRWEKWENFHLIADNLGWFRDEKVNIEDLLKEKGNQITKIVTDQAIELMGLNSEAHEKQ